MNSGQEPSPSSAVSDHITSLFRSIFLSCSLFLCSHISVSFLYSSAVVALFVLSVCSHLVPIISSLDLTCLLLPYPAFSGFLSALVALPCPAVPCMHWLPGTRFKKTTTKRTTPTTTRRDHERIKHTHEQHRVFCELGRTSSQHLCRRAAQGRSGEYNPGDAGGHVLHVQPTLSCGGCAGQLPACEGPVDPLHARTREEVREAAQDSQSVRWTLKLVCMAWPVG